ncbi:MAG: site-2 protease family protein [Chloroflexi bacterium]|nr:site-2 protease family protein [Chloroflexota bacterium]
MESSVRLGRIFGIEIGVHYSWFAILALVVWSLATMVLPEIARNWAIETYWMASLMASFLLFASIVAHELGHCLVAQRLGMPVKSIVLFILGGVSNLTGDAVRPRDELAMAAAGPLTSFLLAVLFWAGWHLFGSISQPLAVVLLYLAFMNGVMAIFNLVPGFPLDGGRILRSALWWGVDDLRLATRLASWVGQGIAGLLILVGLGAAFGAELPFLGTGVFSGVWTVFTGLFLMTASRSSYRQVAFQETFRGIRASQLMTPEPMTVQPTTTIHELLASFLLPRSPGAVPVVQDDRLVGMVTLSCVRQVPPERWTTTLVADVMQRRHELCAVEAEEDLGAALRGIGEDDTPTLAVVSDDRLVGLLPRSNLLQFSKMHDSGMRAA